MMHAHIHTLHVQSIQAPKGQVIFILTFTLPSLPFIFPFIPFIAVLTI